MHVDPAGAVVELSRASAASFALAVLELEAGDPMPDARAICDPMVPREDVLSLRLHPIVGAQEEPLHGLRQNVRDV